MNIKGKKVLVTGADGFIGSHLTERLIEEGAKVRAFCFYNSFGTNGWLDTLEKEKQNALDIFMGDIRDPHGVRTAMKNIDLVFHLAALIGIPYSYHSPDAYVDTNVKGTLNVLQAARELGGIPVVVTSTSEVYGTAQYVPIDELHPLNAQSPYAATKIAADHLALSFYRSFNLPVRIARPFNAYGPRQSSRAIIPTIISQLLSGKSSIRLGNLLPTRDFTFVKDVANGFLAIAESDNAVGEVIHIGSQQEISIKDLVLLLARLMKKEEIEIEQQEERFRPERSEVFRLYCNNEKIVQKASWHPQYTLEQGLQETIEWMAGNPSPNSYRAEIYHV